MRKWSKKWFSKRRMDAIRKAISELKKYRGAEIVAHKHSLHKAIVALEDLVDWRYDEDGKRRNTLLVPARGCWLAMLWASRDEKWPKVPLKTPMRRVTLTAWDKLGPKDHELVFGWKARLLTELEGWLGTVPKDWQYRSTRIDH